MAENPRKLDSHQEQIPVLSIVIVNHDGTSDTIYCLESIFNHPPDFPFEIILVDNCSNDSPFDSIHERFPQVRTISAPRRQSFAINYNLGLGLAQGKFLAILNNDTLVQAGAFQALVNFLNSQKGFGLAGPLILGENGKPDPTCARGLPTPWSYMLIQLALDPAMPAGQVLNALKSARLQRRTSGPAACISGACMLASREAMERVGLLEEAYPLYFEDIEWCHRFQRAGYKVGFVREAEITHLGDRTISKVRLQARKAEYRSAMLYFSAYYPFPRWQRRLLHRSVAFGYALRAWAFIKSEWLTGKKQHAETYRQLRKWIREQPLPGEGAA